MPPEYGAAEFAAEFDVSRETIEKLSLYATLLSEWQSRMNLVGPATLPHVWTRHFRDSAQLISMAPANPSIWLDIGSGAGFPAIVVGMTTGHCIHLVESTRKKCAFLDVVVEACALPNIVVHNDRVEALQAFKADVISARACAPLATLFDWGGRFATPKTLWLLPKGVRYAEEIEQAKRSHHFDYELHPSRTAPEARIIAARLEMRNGSRR